MSLVAEREPRLFLASLSGESDAAWARQGAEFADAAMLGGIAIDEPTRAAARAQVERDRNEFLPADPVAFVDDQLSAVADADLLAGFNVRTTTLEPLRDVAEVCRDHDAILEVNAHCRQDEMCAAGAGETLLRDTDRLCEQVEAAAETGATVSVKVRTEVEGVDLSETARAVVAAGTDVVHVDAMDSEPVVEDVVEAVPDAYVVANNEVRDTESVLEYLNYGADAVSVGRPSDEPAVLERVRAAVDTWFESDDTATTRAGPTETAEVDR